MRKIELDKIFQKIGEQLIEMEQMQRELNEAHGRIAALEGELTKLKAESVGSE